MKNCRYFLELNGDEVAIELLKKYVPREMRNLRDAREVSRSIDTIFGSSITPRIIVRRVSNSVSAYLLDPIGRHS